jgi:hypothetical protein
MKGCINVYIHIYTFVIVCILVAYIRIYIYIYIYGCCMYELARPGQRCFFIGKVIFF